MTTCSGWLPRITKAETEDELVHVVHEYVATWPPSDLDRMPPECRVRVIATGADISIMAVTLVQCELRGEVDDAAADVLHQIADVFVTAQSRLRHILGRAHDPSVA